MGLVPLWLRVHVGNGKGSHMSRSLFVTRDDLSVLGFALVVLDRVLVHRHLGTPVDLAADDLLTVCDEAIDYCDDAGVDLSSDTLRELCQYIGEEEQDTAGVACDNLASVVAPYLYGADGLWAVRLLDGSVSQTAVSQTASSAWAAWLQSAEATAAERAELAEIERRVLDELRAEVFGMSEVGTYEEGEGDTMAEEYGQDQRTALYERAELSF